MVVNSVALVDALEDRRALLTSSSRRWEALASVSVMPASCLLSKPLAAAELGRLPRSMSGESLLCGGEMDASGSSKETVRSAPLEVVMYVTCSSL